MEGDTVQSKALRMARDVMEAHIKAQRALRTWVNGTATHNEVVAQIADEIQGLHDDHVMFIPPQRLLGHRTIKLARESYDKDAGMIFTLSGLTEIARQNYEELRKLEVDLLRGYVTTDQALDIMDGVIDAFADFH